MVIDSNNNHEYQERGPKIHEIPEIPEMTKSQPVLRDWLSKAWKWDIPLDYIEEELKSHPVVSVLYETTDKLEIPAREWTFMDIDSDDFKDMIWSICGDEQKLSEWVVSYYLRFEKRSDWLVWVNLIKVEPSTEQWFVWVKKEQLKDFVGIDGE